MSSGRMFDASLPRQESSSIGLTDDRHVETFETRCLVGGVVGAAVINHDDLGGRATCAIESHFEVSETLRDPA